ncbi:MAG TPA: aldolase catalytic domain-containing protein [Pseudogracilibacillus sp.]|nr:aldolase catalytic domain-containing protein [Pseudogracilibacillus sp.]
MNDVRPKIVDCTIRDGGLVNNWDFSEEFVKDLYENLNRAGVEYMEIGYKNSPELIESNGAGPWRFCDDQFLKKIIPEKKQTKISALVDVGRVKEEDILPREESVVDLIRVACYMKDIEKGIALAEVFHERGYETSLNIMAVSNALQYQLEEGLQKVNDSHVDIVYVVDSFGSLFNRDIEFLIDVFKKHAPNKQLGIHTHNNLQLAFANTLLGKEKGVTYLDASLMGMGRAAGNCPTELLVGTLDNPHYHLEPVLQLLEKHMIPMREKVEWGYTIPYAIAGMLNEHPRTAMQLRASDQKDDYVQFYKGFMTVEKHSQ